MLTTGTQLAVLAGGLIAGGLVLVVMWLVPARPDALDVARRYSPEAITARASAPVPVNSTDRAGIWAIRRLPTAWWGTTPTKELSLLQIPLHRHLGKKVTAALTGLILPPTVTLAAAMLGYHVPFAVPALASVLLSVGMFFAPDFDVRREAARARVDFNRALGAYIDLVALERMGGSGPRQAMEEAAGVGTNWVFRRLAEELRQSRFSGKAPWDALHELADELGLPELIDVANVMRTTEQGAQVYASLRSTADDLRSRMLADEQALANRTSTSMNVPLALMVPVFFALVGMPAMLQLMGGS